MNILPGLLACPRFFHLRRLYFSPWRLNPPPQRACGRPRELLHSAWSHSSNAPFTTSILRNAGLWQTDSESSPLASELFRRFIIQSGSSSKCVFFFFFYSLLLACKYRFISLRWFAGYWAAEQQQQRSLQGKKVFCSDVWHKRLIHSRQNAGSRTGESFWVYRCRLPWWHNVQCTTPSG